MGRVKLASVFACAMAMVIAGAPAVGATPPQDEPGLVSPEGEWVLFDGVAAALIGPAEVPGPGDADATGKGYLNLDSDGGWVCFSIEHSGIDGTVNGAHIHRGAVGVSGGIEVDLDYATNGDRGCVSAGTDLIAEISGNTAGFYLNVHSTAFPAGAIRGQLDGNSATFFFFGNPNDFPFMGDWDCDGVDTPGLYRQGDGFVYLRNSNTQGNADVSFFFGNPGDIPLAGDFNGDGCDTVSLYRPQQGRVYIINELGSGDAGLGAADFDYDFGSPGDDPVVGDWDGDGIDTIGVHRPTTGEVLQRNSNTTGAADATLLYGNPGDRFFTGDWDGNPTDTPGVFRDSIFYLRNSNTTGVADQEIFAFVFPNDASVPIAGKRVPQPPDNG